METSTDRRLSRAYNDFYLHLGQRLQKARRARGWDQDDAADASGLNKQALASYERGDRRIPVETLVTLSRAYGVTVSALLPVNDPQARRSQAEEELLRAFRVFASLPGPVPAPRDGGEG